MLKILEIFKNYREMNRQVKAIERQKEAEELVYEAITDLIEEGLVRQVGADSFELTEAGKKWKNENC